MSFNKTKRTVHCDVSNCLYNDNEEGDCRLIDVSISSLGRGSECDEASSTLCQSFENSGGIITDNEYEVSSEFIPEDYDIEIEEESII